MLHWITGVYQQLQEYETKLFGPSDVSNPALCFPTLNPQPFSFGYQKSSDPITAPAFNTVGSASIFAGQNLEVSPQGFTFGAASSKQNVSEGGNPSDIPMDSSWCGNSYCILILVSSFLSSYDVNCGWISVCLYGFGSSNLIAMLYNTFSLPLVNQYDGDTIMVLSL